VAGALRGLGRNCHDAAHCLPYSRRSAEQAAFKIRRLFDQNHRNPGGDPKKCVAQPVGDTKSANEHKIALSHRRNPSRILQKKGKWGKL
jgi:hypothetical protein